MNMYNEEGEGGDVMSLYFLSSSRSQRGHKKIPRFREI